MILLMIQIQEEWKKINKFYFSKISSMLLEYFGNKKYIDWSQFSLIDLMIVNINEYQYRRTKQQSILIIAALKRIFNKI